MLWNWEKIGVILNVVPSVSKMSKLPVCSKFRQLCFYQILFELVYRWESHRKKNIKTVNFLLRQCRCFKQDCEILVEVGKHPTKPRESTTVPLCECWLILDRPGQSVVTETVRYSNGYCRLHVLGYRSRDKDDGDTIQFQSVSAEDITLHANFMALRVSSIVPGLLPID